MDWGSVAPEQKVPTEERRETSMQAKFMCSKFTYLFLLLFMITIIQTTDKYKPFLPFTLTYTPRQVPRTTNIFSSL